MNTCEQFRGFILTDYSDGQAGPEMLKQLEEHLQGCSACRALIREVKDRTVAPFARSGGQDVPPDLWASIRERIEREQGASNPARDWLGRLTEVLVWLRFVPVLASIVLLVSVSVLLFGRLGYQAKENEQQEYWKYVFASSDTALDAEDGDLGTPIEQYFL